MYTGMDEPVVIDVPEGQIEADLRLPRECTGLVLFAHGSGSGRFSRRNRDVASWLEDNGFGTLQLDLLTRQEERIDEHTREYRFNVALLGYRVVAAIDWVRARPDLSSLPLGCFGASTGAAAAFLAAADRPSAVLALVSCGGRLDLAGEALSAVRAATLLVIGGTDLRAIDANRDALRRLAAPAELVIVPGVADLFEEPGALEEVMAHVGKWFSRHLAGV